MKSIYKTFGLGILVIGALALSTLPTQAQLGTPPVIWSTTDYTASLGVAAANVNTYCGTNNLAVNTNNIVDVSRAVSISIGFRSQLTTSGTTTNTVVIEKGVDGNYWEPFDRLNTTSSGTTFIGYTTNYTTTMQGYAKLRFTVLTSAAASAPLTNSTLTVNVVNAYR